MGAPPRRQRHLVLQGNTWWARFRVPRDVREAFDNKAEKWERLGTDLKIAEARCHRAYSDFRAHVLEARGRAGTIQEDALAWSRDIAKEAQGEADNINIGDIVREAAIREASSRFVPGGYKVVQRRATLFHDGDEAAALLERGGPKAQTFVAIALEGRKPLFPFVEPWYTVRKTEVEAETASMDKTAVERFIQEFPLATGVKKAAVAEWIEKRKADVAPQTVQREVTGIRSFWAYLKARQEVPDDIEPFSGQRFKERRKDRQRNQRVDFAASEVAALYGAAIKTDDQQLADLIALAAYTGARREELCSLKIEDVTKGWINIKDAKTDAGNRDVPVHAAIVPTFKRLIGKRINGYVFEDTGEDKWGNRGDALGKRFTHLKKGAKFGPEKTFHSIRRTFAAQLRAQNVPLGIRAVLMGHKTTTMTDEYAGTGSARRLLPAAVAKLRYPKPL